jgi:hypothetical protein
VEERGAAEERSAGAARAVVGHACLPAQWEGPASRAEAAAREMEAVTVGVAMSVGTVALWGKRGRRGGWQC